MKVVGHQTVRMKPVGMAGGTFEQQREDTLSGRFLAEIRLAVVTEMVTKYARRPM